MDIIFEKCSLADDTRSIAELLYLGEGHERVKQYICDYFQLDEAKLQTKVRNELEKKLTPVIQSEQEKYVMIMEETLKSIIALWTQERENINQILCDIFEYESKNMVWHALMPCENELYMEKRE